MSILVPSFYPAASLPANFTQRAICWANRHFEACLYLDNQEIAYPQGGFPKLLAVGAPMSPPEGENPFTWMQEQWQEHGHLFGYLGYDLKNHLEALESNNVRLSPLGDCTLFAPQHLIEWTEQGILRISSPDAERIKEEILHTPIQEDAALKASRFSPLTSKEDYIQTVKALKNHILEGDIYEINYCMAFEAQAQAFDPTMAFHKLQRQSPMPFSSFLKIHDQYALCASPERFMKKQGQTLISQPIKGTIKRGQSEQEDRELRERLFNSEKERAENLMIVDLVRNDLARSSVYGSVKVDELFGIYTFKQLHQMISTVSSELADSHSPIAAIANAFPMGSMTGAPKVKSMELIEQYEHTRRGLFSGAIGMLEPNGDFDFNVVIRTLFYDQQAQKLSFQVGSAITYDADPEYEYEECLLKASSLLKICE